MKKLYLSFVLAAIFSAGYGQSFALIYKTGFRNAEDISKGYVVIEFPGKNQQELFDAAKNYVIASYVSPNDVISYSSPDIISMRGYAVVPMYFNRLTGRKASDMNYKVTLYFKPGKIKMEFTIISWLFSGDRSFDIKDKMYGAFDKKGEVDDLKSKNNAENVPNGIIESLKDYINNVNNNEDW